MLRNLPRTLATVSTVGSGRRPAAEIIGERGLRGRRLLKRVLYAQLALREAVMIATGRSQPLVRFTVEADPPSIYLVFRLRADTLDTLVETLDLPAELEPCPLRCVRDEEPAHYLTLNVYRVSGITNAMRAEWSIYVTDRELPGTPRYLVVDARSSTPSMDPVDVITPAGTVEHRVDGPWIVTTVGDGDEAFRSTIRLDDTDAGAARTASEWASANDRIYWRNGVRDRTFYDAGMADPALSHVDAAAVTVSDGSPWAAYIEPEPAHTLVHRDAIELVIQPWENIDRIGR